MKRIHIRLFFEGIEYLKIRVLDMNFWSEEKLLVVILDVALGQPNFFFDNHAGMPVLYKLT